MLVVVSVLFTGVLALRLRCIVTCATCEESKVLVLVVTAEKQQLFGKYEEIDVGYGGNIIIYCTGLDSKNLTISLNTKDEYTFGRGIQVTEIVNMTTRKLIMENPAIDVYDFTCTDVVTTCLVTFSVVVYPVITVMSSSVRLLTDNGFSRRYTVPAGEDYELVCSGNPPLAIRMESDNLFNGIYDIQTISLNTTTTKSIKLNKKNSNHIFQYVCHHEARGFPMISICEVIINHDYPVLKDFWCIEIDLQMNCTWHVQGMDGTSTLLYKDKYGKSMLLHTYKITSSDNYSGTWRCEWSLENVKKHGLEYHNDISLALKACRFSYCAHHTYLIDRTSIIKCASPVGLEVVETEPNRAVIMWNYNEGYPVEYNITYQLSGLEWAQKLKASSQENCDGGDCKLEIKLPCPGVLYELKMYAKSTTAPQETAYWSDSATITFHADSQDSTGLDSMVDPICNEEPESIVNKYVGEHKVKELRRSFMMDGAVLFGKIQSMERKLDLIKELCREQSLGDCEHRSDYVLSAVKMP